MSDIEELRTRVLQLPQERDSWLVVVRRLRSWLQEGDEVLRVWTLMCLSRSAGTIIGNEILLGPPEPEEALEHILGFMLEPAQHSVDRPHRPAKVVFEDKTLARELRDELGALEVRGTHGSAPSQVDLILADFEAALRGEEQEEIPGLLVGERVTPKIVGDFFAAAADFYRAEPWIALSNTQTLAISFPPQEQTWYVTVMGQGGVEYGLVLQRTWEQVKQLFHDLDDPLEGMPTEGWHSVSFEPEYALPFDDLEAIETYGLEVAAEDAYPLPAIFDRETALRPPGEELVLWSRVMRAVVAFAGEHLQSDGTGDYNPVEVEFEVGTPNGAVTARVRYPAGERDRGDEAYHDLPPEGAQESLGRVPNRRAMEVTLLDLVGGFGDAQLERAQRLIYEAWGTPERAARLRLAEQALEISPHCADAYVVLAEERAKTVREALELFQKGVVAGEAALGPEIFDRDAGHFWGLLETRPYMRARQGLANCLFKLGRFEEAEGHYRELLRLNPSDNQGVRYALLQLLIERRRDEAALELIEQYDEDPSALMTCNRALLLFRQHGATEEAGAALEKALQYNVHLPVYLLGRKRVPRDLPAAIGFGDDREAVDYAAAYLNHWRATTGALDWLRGHLPVG